MLQADLYMREPLFLVTNKTESGIPWVENDDPRIYFSLSDHYWPFQVSSVNPFGTPYRYNASVNLEVCYFCILYHVQHCDWQVHNRCLNDIAFFAFNCHSLP